MRFTRVAVLLATLTLAGCGQYEPAKSRGRSAAPEAVGVVVDPFSPAPPVGAAAPNPSPPATPQTQPPASVPPAMPLGQPPAMPLGQPPAEGQDVIREKADVGMGRKGDYSQGFITTPLSTFWRTKEMVAYRVQVPHALQLYQAANGYYPKTKDDFVREILEPNGIKLPELPQGHYYVYDSDKGELQVARPR